MDDNRVWNVVTLMNISSGELNECVSILCRYIQSTQQKIVFILQSDILLRMLQHLTGTYSSTFDQ